MICLSIHQLLKTWIAPTFWLLWIMLVWTCVCKYLFKFLLFILFEFVPYSFLLFHNEIYYWNFLCHKYSFTMIFKWVHYISILPCSIFKQAFIFPRNKIRLKDMTDSKAFAIFCQVTTQKARTTWHGWYLCVPCPSAN